MDPQKNAQFRKLLKRPGALVCAGVYDCLSARIAEQTGFDVVYMTGNGAMGSLIGRPDLGLATMTNMVERAHQIASAVKVPLFCDCDNGYGNENNLQYAIEEFEAAGVSGVHIEDQGYPKRCGAMPGVTLVEPADMVKKLKVAVAARKDPNFLICARTDSTWNLGVDEAIRRCKIYADSGVDMVYAEMLRTRPDLEKFAKAMEGFPIAYDHLETEDGHQYSVKDLEDLGFKLVFNCLSASFATAHVLRNVYAHYKNEGETKGFLDKMVPIREFEKILGIDEYKGH